MTELSPEARAVLGAYLRAPVDNRKAIAAALRAAADQVAPNDYTCFTGHVEWDQGMEARNDSIRENLLAIASDLEKLAAELEGAQPTGSTH